MPINLGDLPSNLPAPLGQGQVKPGGSPEGQTNYTNATAGTPILDGVGVGVGVPMRISLTPQYECWWRVVAFCILNGSDAVWSRADFGIDLAPTDMDGYYRCQGCNYTHPTVGWNHGRVTAFYHLRAGVAYTATMMWLGAPSGYNQQIWNGFTYCALQGHTIAEGRL